MNARWERKEEEDILSAAGARASPLPFRKKRAIGKEKTVLEGRLRLRALRRGNV